MNITLQGKAISFVGNCVIEFMVFSKKLPISIRNTKNNQGISDQGGSPRRTPDGTDNMEYK